VTSAIRDRHHAASSEPRTGRELLATVGRLVLWAAVGLVLLRGAGDLVGVGRPSPTVRVHRSGDRVPWPDDAARALAIEFTAAYLTHTPGEDPADYARRLSALASPAVAHELAPVLHERAPRQAVRTATVERAVLVDRRRSLVTVAATVQSGEELRPRRVTVPIARDGTGGVVVYDLPALAPAPARASAAPIQGDPLLGTERAAIEDVLKRFLRAYLAGDTRGLDYLVPPGTRISAAAGGRLELLQLGSIAASGPVARNERVVLVKLLARDAESRATYALRYRVRVVRRDRWYVAALNGGRGTR
jgi:Conjugative transposon protein TcpC